MSHLSDALTRREQLRIAAVSLAGARVAGVPGNAALFQEADAIFGWLVRPETTQIKATTQVLRDGDVIWVGQVTVSGPEGNTPLMTAMFDADTATIVLDPKDSMGQDTGDALTVTQSDGGAPGVGGAAGTPGSVASVTVNTDANGKATDVTLTPVATGSVTITVDDPSAPDVAAFVNTFDVAAGATSSIVGIVTVNTGANTPPAPPAT
jgi:hypothetical protein